MNRLVLTHRLVEVDGLRLPAIDPTWLDDDEPVLCFVFPSENGAELHVQVDDDGATVHLWLASWRDRAGVVRLDVECAIRDGRIVPVDVLAPETGDERVLLSLAGPTMIECLSATELAMTLADVGAMPVDVAHPLDRLGA